MLSSFIGIRPFITTAQENSSSTSVPNIIITANSSITDAKMKMDQIYASNNPEDIATLA